MLNEPTTNRETRREQKQESQFPCLHRHCCTLRIIQTNTSVIQIVFTNVQTDLHLGDLSKVFAVEEVEKLTSVKRRDCAQLMTQPLGKKRIIEHMK